MPIRAPGHRPGRRPWLIPQTPVPANPTLITIRPPLLSAPVKKIFPDPGLFPNVAANTAVAVVAPPVIPNLYDGPIAKRLAESAPAQLIPGLIANLPPNLYDGPQPKRYGESPIQPLPALISSIPPHLYDTAIP